MLMALSTEKEDETGAGGAGQSREKARLKQVLL